MLCPICKADIPADSAFCPKCGQRIGSAEVAAAAPAGGNPTAAERMRTAQQAGAAHAEPEHELWRGRYTPKDMYAKWVLAGLVTIAAIVLAVVVHNPAAWIAAAIVIPVIWLGLLMMLVSRRLGVEYTLTTQRFLHKTGLLRRVADQ